jgi:glutamate-1-semialdehyde 2,1-aminomutase
MQGELQTGKMLSREWSRALYREAQSLMPGGVNSPVRAFRAVGGEPIFIERGEGAYLYDVDGNRYLDYVGSWGPLILGHAQPAVVEAVTRAARRGFSFGAPTEAESELARLIVEQVPSVEMVRFVNSGTEATMSALRLARAYTGRSRIVKFSGCYHGHADFLLVEAGSGVATLGLPASAGVTPEIAAQTLSLPYNDSAAVEEAFRRYPEEIAAVIVEPLAANMGLVLPEPGFLETLRRLTTQHGALLIFDEVITGFRVAAGGMQARCGVMPDLTCFGKIIGGGLPVGAYGGRREIMQLVAPLGPVYQAGTLSGNPLAMAAGIATLKALLQPGCYEELEQKGALLEEGLRAVVAELEMPLQVVRFASLFCLFFSPQPVRNYAEARGADSARYARFFWKLLERGVYFPPSQFETCFLSLAHTSEMLERTVTAVGQALRELQQEERGTAGGSR